MLKTDRFARCLVVPCLLLVIMLGSCSNGTRSVREDDVAETGKGDDGDRMTTAEPESVAPPRRREATIPVGADITVRTTASISTKSNQPGQSFSAVLEQPIVDNDWVIAAKGAVVEGLISECDPGGRVKGVAQLAVTLQRLTLVDGRIIDLQTSSIRRQAQSTKKKDAQKIGVGAGIGAAVGAIAGGGKGAAIGAAVGGGGGTGVVLATHGDPATIASESKLTFKLTAPVTILE